MKKQVFNLGPEGLTEAKQKPSLQIGSRVYSFGAGMNEKIYAVISEPDTRGAQKLVSMSANYEGDYFNPFQTIDNYARPISKKFGIGFYWDDINPDFLFSSDGIAQAIKAANIFEAERQRKAEEKSRKDKEERENLPKLYPYLTPNPKDDTKTTKSNLVAMLKHTFPGIKFSVKKDNYSTYNVEWTNGPTKEQVSKITNKFESHESSYCGDFRDYNPSNFNRVFGGFEYIFEYRNISDDLLTLAEEIPNRPEEYHYQTNVLYKILSKTEIPAGYTAATIERTEITCGSIEDFYRVVFEIPEKAEAKPIETGTIQMVQYSEKAIVITGDTFPIKDTLKILGGKFNKFLSCGAGWIFPASKAEEIKKALLL